MDFSPKGEQHGEELWSDTSPSPPTCPLCALGTSLNLPPLAEAGQEHQPQSACQEKCAKHLPIPGASWNDCPCSHPVQAGVGGNLQGTQ